MKRLLRKWLKRKLIKIEIKHKNSRATNHFEWIYDSPIQTWRDKLLIVKAYEDLCDKHYEWLNSDKTC